MKHLILVLIAAAVIFPTCGASAAETAPAQNPQTFDKIPEPVGGLDAIMQLVSYPKSAKEDGLEGKVLLTVTIDASGNSTSVKVLEGVRDDLDKAALKALKQSKWIPAQKDGMPVETTVVVPVQFRLAEKKSK